MGNIGPNRTKPDRTRGWTGPDQAKSRSASTLDLFSVKTYEEQLWCTKATSTNKKCVIFSHFLSPLQWERKEKITYFSNERKNFSASIVVPRHLQWIKRVGICEICGVVMKSLMKSSNGKFFELNRMEKILNLGQNFCPKIEFFSILRQKYK